MPDIRDEQVRALLAGRRAIRRVPYPGAPEIEIGIRVLSETEIDDARFDANDYLEKRAKKAGTNLDAFLARDPDTYSREHERQIIQRATFNVDTLDEPKPYPFFPSIGELRSIDGATVSQLFAQYLDLLDAIDPKLRLTDEQKEEFITLLGKGPTEPVLLAQFAPDTLRDLLRIMAARLVTSQSGNSSTSSNS